MNPSSACEVTLNLSTSTDSSTFQTPPLRGSSSKCIRAKPAAANRALKHMARYRICGRNRFWNIVQPVSPPSAAYYASGMSRVIILLPRAQARTTLVDQRSVEPAGEPRVYCSILLSPKTTSKRAEHVKDETFPRSVSCSEEMQAHLNVSSDLWQRAF